MEKFIRAAATLAVLTSIGFGVAGCNRTENDGSGSSVTQRPAAPRQSQPASAAQTADLTPAAAATVGVTRDPGSASAGRSSVLGAVRTGARRDADRVVFEFDGTGLPAWEVAYVDRPVRDCGSGEPVPVAGDAWLQVRFTGAQAHTEAGASTSGPRRRPLGQAIAKELVRTCDFEGEVTWVIGVASPNAYTPRVLSQPPRLVIDIAH